MSIDQIAEKVRRGGRVTRGEALELYRDAPTPLIGQLADGVRARKHPESIVTYIIDRNVNYTNVCVAKCSFCAFYRDVGSPDGYVLGFDELFRKIDETVAVGGVQLLLQGGHNPDLPLKWYEDLFRAVKERYPTFKLHALSPPEVIHLARLTQLPVAAIIDRLIAAGLDSIPGGGAEILVDRVRSLLHCYGKASAYEWLDVMRSAHRAGLRTTATMMYGTVETDEERIEHLLRLRALQDETGGFTAFIAWSYQPDNTGLAGDEATGVDYLRTLAPVRDFIHRDDVAEGLVRLAEAGSEPGLRVFNLSSGVPTSIAQLADLAGRAVGHATPAIETEPGTRREDQIALDVGALFRRTGWKPAIPLFEGLAQTLHAIRDEAQ